MKLTWRAYAARYYAFLDTGESLCGRFYKLLVAGAALKILWPTLPVWVMVAASPFVVLGYILIGSLWLRRGWYREAMEVGVVNALDPVQMFLAHAAGRLLDHHKIPQNGYDPRSLPPGLEHVLVSAKKGAA